MGSVEVDLRETSANVTKESRKSRLEFLSRSAHARIAFQHLKIVIRYRVLLLSNTARQESQSRIARIF